MPTISLNIAGDEAPASVSLRTLTRSDTGETVAGVTLPDDFTDDGGGDWSYTFTAPADNLHYDYTFRLTWADASFNDASGGLDDLAGTPSYEGDLTTSTEVRTFLNNANVAVHGDLNGDLLEDAGTMQQSIEMGEAEVYANLGGPIASFTDDAAGAAARLLLSTVATKLASYNLAAKRGFASQSENEFRIVRGEALEALKAFAGNPYGIEIDGEIDDEETDAGTFQFIPINRGTSCEDDE